MDAVLAFGNLSLDYLLRLLFFLLALLGNWSRDDGLLVIRLEILHLGVIEDLIRHDVLSQLAQLLICGPKGWIYFQCLQEVLLGIGVSGLFLTHHAKKVQPVTAIGHRVVVLGL